MKLSFVILLLSLCFCSTAQTNTPRKLEAKRIISKIVIDGVLNEDAWKKGSLINDFSEFRPVPNRKEIEHNKTIAYLIL